MSAPESKKILVVDDDPDIQKFCRTILEKEGYAVVPALSAAEGQRLAQSERPDLVVLDIMMEASDSGFHLAGWLSEQSPGLPVLMLSSIADAAGQVFDTSTLPVAELIPKPIEPKELIAKIEKLLARRAPSN
ncbi:MAG: response regulator transcription factor [Deltaproteobacteria bacterium]|nr:response regulator transcription factor [Deltaproteobacteria bacterium]